MYNFVTRAYQPTTDLAPSCHNTRIFTLCMTQFYKKVGRHRCMMANEHITVGSNSHKK